MMKRVLLFAFAIGLLISSPFFLFACGPNSNDVKRSFYEISEDSFEGKTFPFIRINVEDNKEIVSKDEYLSCTVDVTNTTENYVYSQKPAKIKGRGNSTWGMPKKPYKLKFDSKINLFGFGKAKSYSLIANYCDKSLSRNYIAYEIAEELGLSETTSAQPVNLVVNGEYYGVYLLCEQNEIGSNRVDIESDLSDIDTGYLVELDARALDEGVLGVDYFAIADNNYAIKDPETTELEFTAEHFAFISNYFNSCYNAISGSDYSAVCDLIDVESFAKCYLVHELLNCVDVGFSSFYFHKKSGGKLFAGPLWDFDISSGNCDYIESSNSTENLYAKNSNVWYKKLLKFPEFKNLVSDKLNEYKTTISQTIDRVLNFQLEYAENNKANFEVWKILKKYVWPNPRKIVKIKTFEGQVNYLKTWLEEKLNYMVQVYLPNNT